jgi:hypothetical protein
VPSISPAAAPPAARRAGARQQPPARPTLSSRGSTTSASPQASIAGHQVGGTAAEAAVGLGQGNRGQAHLGKRAHTASLKPVAELTMALRCSKLVVVARYLLHRVGQLLLFVAVGSKFM